MWKSSQNKVIHRGNLGKFASKFVARNSEGRHANTNTRLSFFTEMIRELKFHGTDQIPQVVEKSIPVPSPVQQ